MIAERGLALATARSRASTIRTYLRVNGGELVPSDADLRTNAVLWYESSLKTRPHQQAFRNAWRTFAEFLTARGRPVTVPEFPDRRRQGMEHAHALGEPLVHLAVHFRFEHIAELYIHDLCRPVGPDKMEVRCASARKTITTFPREQFERLYRYHFPRGVAPDREEERRRMVRPAFALAPGDPPMNAGQLRLIARQARRVMVQEGRVRYEGEFLFLEER